jgi:hypothetical protein
MEFIQTTFSFRFASFFFHSKSFSAYILIDVGNHRQKLYHAIGEMGVWTVWGKTEKKEQRIVRVKNVLIWKMRKEQISLVSNLQIRKKIFFIEVFVKLKDRCDWKSAKQSRVPKVKRFQIGKMFTKHTLNMS